jgi:hypothetical protein
MKEFTKSAEDLQRQAFRRTVYHIWGMIQAGLVDEMNEAEYAIARILLEHPEYGDFFEDEKILDGRKFDTGSAVNPFLHVSLHKMIEDQLEAGHPEEVRFFFESMEAKGNDRHEIVHVIMKILSILIFEAMHSRQSLDVDRYRSILEQCRNFSIDKITEILDRKIFGH